MMFSNAPHLCKYSEHRSEEVMVGQEKGSQAKPVPSTAVMRPSSLHKSTTSTHHNQPERTTRAFLFKHNLSP